MVNWNTITAISPGAPGRLMAMLDCGHVLILRVCDLIQTAAAKPETMIGSSRPCRECKETEGD